MTIEEILLNPSVKDIEQELLNAQAWELYGLLKLGPVTTSKAAAKACQYNARINEIRHALFKIGKMIDMVEGDGGENSYIIVPLEKSTFWEKVKSRGEDWKWS